jgi:hypothetical protein
MDNRAGFDFLLHITIRTAAATIKLRGIFHSPAIPSKGLMHPDYGRTASKLLQSVWRHFGAGTTRDLISR